MPHNTDHFQVRLGLVFSDLSLLFSLTPRLVWSPISAPLIRLPDLGIANVWAGQSGD